MIVVDASAALAALLRRGQARAALADHPLHVPHLVDTEVAHALRRRAASGGVTDDVAWRALHAWQRLAVTRHPTYGLLARVWELRHNLSAYDASYVALAEALARPVLTADARLARAPGVRCAVTVVPG